MIKILPLIICSLTAISTFSQNPEKFKELKSLGLIYFAEPYLYLHETEVSNLAYREYLYWLQTNKDSQTYKKALPDQTQWQKIGLEAYSQFYLFHSAYQSYPVVNVSQQQARDFCTWLQNRINERLRKMNSDIDSVVVRLPSTKEWILAASKGTPTGSVYPWGTNSIRSEEQKYRGMMLLNVLNREPLFDYKVADVGFVTTPVASYWPSKAGFYNLSGNAAEWVDESGMTKGGSWLRRPYRARIDQPGFLDGDSSANPETGFRYLIEIVSIKPKKKTPTFELDKKYIKENFRQCAPKLYTQTTELSNWEYQQFLKENPNDQYRIHSEKWAKYTRYAYYRTYGQEGKFSDYPVVNISHQAAKAYCEWLTNKYNALSSKPFKKVVFRLPTEAEWDSAFYEGSSEMPFPWGGPYYLNSRSAYLANLFPFEEEYADHDSLGNTVYKYPDSDYSISRDADGYAFLAPCKSFFTYNFQSYCYAGNAAEMVSQEGISRGGSWNSPLEGILAHSREKYTGPNPMLGFRVFMEIIEE